MEDEERNIMTRDSSFVKQYYGDNETRCESNNNSTSAAIDSGNNGLSVTSIHLFVSKNIACVKLYFLLRSYFISFLYFALYAITLKVKKDRGVAIESMEQHFTA